MKVSVFGSGYVGLVTGACLAEVGNQVVCVDVDQGKIDLLNRGGVPIFEPGMDDLIQRNRAAGRLTFTTAVEQGVEHGLLQFIAVGTPPDEDGSADLQHVLTVARSIGAHMNDYKIIVDKSTVPVGTADRVRAAVGAAEGGAGEHRAQGGVEGGGVAGGANGVGEHVALVVGCGGHAHRAVTRHG